MSSPDTPVVSEEPLVLCYYVGEGAWPGPWVDHVVVATVFFSFHVSLLMQYTRALGTFSGPLTYEYPLDLIHYFSVCQRFLYPPQNM